MTKEVLNAELNRGDVSQEFGKILARQQKLREEADYSTDTSFSIEDVTTALEDVEKFRELAYQTCTSAS